MRIDNKLHEFLKSRVRWGNHPPNALMITKFRCSDSEIDEALERLESAGRIVMTGSGLARKFVVHDVPVEYVEPEPVVAKRSIVPHTERPNQIVISYPLREAKMGIATLDEADEHLVPDECTCDHFFTDEKLWQRTYHLGCLAHAAIGATVIIDNPLDGGSDAGSYAKALDEPLADYPISECPQQNSLDSAISLEGLIGWIEQSAREADHVSPIIITFDLACAALSRFEGHCDTSGKPRVSAAILRASLVAQKPLHEFCTDLMNEGLKVWEQANG